MTHGVVKGAAVVLGLVLGLGLAEASPPRASSAIAGSWVCEMNGITLTLVLGGGGKGTFNGEPIGWSYAGTTLTLTMEGEQSAYHAVVNGNSMEMSGGDLPAAATFRRQGTAPAANDNAPAAPAGGTIVGIWTVSANGQTVTLELGGDGNGKFNGVPFSWQYSGTTLTVSAQGQTQTYQATVRGDRLDVSGGNLPAPVSMTRQGGGGGAKAAPAARPGGTGIVGVWIYVNGSTRLTLELGADGNGKFNGNALTWKQAGGSLTITAAGGQTMTYAVAVRGDNLDISGGDLPGPATLHRQGSEPAAAPSSGPAGLAGVYSCTESSVDPSIVMIYTQYVTLYPDGSVAYAKSEGGANRSQVTENLERFRSWHQGGPTTGNAGRWESDGQSIVIRWRYWNNLVSRGAVDMGSGRFQLSGMGVLQEGATLTFKRE